MNALIDRALADPWQTLATVLDGPAHPGGTAATERLLERAAVRPGNRVLDVGCGDGAGLNVAAEQGADAIGVDVSPRTKTAIRGTATDLPVADGTVDIVLSECVLCLTDLPTSLNEAQRVLKDGGRLALSDVVIDGGSPDIPDVVADALCLEGARSRDQLEQQVSDAGLAIQSMRDHEDDLLAMRDRVRQRVDYESLLSVMGERGDQAMEVIDTVEAAVRDGRIGYVSIVATA